VSFCISLDHFIPVLLASIALGLVSSVSSQEIGSKMNVSEMTYSMSSNSVNPSADAATIFSLHLTRLRLLSYFSLFCCNR